MSSQLYQRLKSDETCPLVDTQLLQYVLLNRYPAVIQQVAAEMVFEQGSGLLQQKKVYISSCMTTNRGFLKGAATVREEMIRKVMGGGGGERLFARIIF